MAEKKPYGTEYMDRFKGGVSNVLENEYVQDFGRGLVNNPLSKGITQFVIDPLAELALRGASAKGIFPFLPDTSILTALTPEVTVDRETRESIDADITQYPTMGERLEKRMDRFRADLGALGQFLYGEQRDAGENLRETGFSMRIKDLPPEQRLAARLFLADVPVFGVGPAAKAGAKATKELENLELLKSQMVTRDGSMGAADVKGMLSNQLRNTVGDVGDDEIQYLASFYNDLPPEIQTQVSGLLNENELQKLNTFLNPPKPIGQPGGDEISRLAKAEDQKLFDGFETELSTGNFNIDDPQQVRLAFANAFTGGERKTKFTGTDPLSKDKNYLRALSRKIIDYNNSKGFDAFDASKGFEEGRVYNRDQIQQINRFLKVGEDSLEKSSVRNNFEKYLNTNDVYNNLKNNMQPLDDSFYPIVNGKVKRDFTKKLQRYLNFVRETSAKTKDPVKGSFDPFMKEFDLDIKALADPNSIEYKNFQKFAYYDKIREEVGDITKPVLNKIFKAPERRPDGSLRTEQERIDEARNSIQIAHTFESSQVGDTVGEGLTGAGMIPGSYYLDISNYNAIQQPKLEAKARNAYEEFNKTGNMEKLNEVSGQLEKLGAEIAVGEFVLGKHKTLAEKIETLIGGPPGSKQREIFKKQYGISDEEIVNLENAIDLLNESGLRANLNMNKGGIVDAADVQYAAPGGFFSKMFGKPPAYMKEEIAKTDIFSPTTKQQATLTALGPEATAINPGQVFYSNIELSLSKPNSPVKFDSEKEFYDYINAAGIGRDEVGDARIGPYISAKAKSGEPILSQDIIQITSESPLNQLTTDGYGFRSDKINIAKRDIPEKYDSPAITKGQAVYKEPRYSGTGLMPGYLPNTYRERVLQIDSDKFRGDPGSLADPAARNHSFGDNYTIAWGRATDRPAIVNEGEMVDKATGTIINPLALTDTKKLQDIEAKIQTLVDDPLTKVDPNDFQTISQAVEALVQKSGGRLTYDKAKQAVDAQIVQKQKQLRKLQSQFVDEEKRLESISTMKPQNITMTFIDEIQSDIAQAATRKSKELAAKLDVMAEQGISFEAMREGIDRDVLQFFAENKSVARPVGATKLELMPQYEELMAFQKQFSDMGKKRPYELTTQDFAMYENFKKRQGEIIDSMADEINAQLMKALYPDVPLKDRGSWSDAVLKQQLYEAAHRLFVEKDPRAPTHLGVASGDIVAGKAYRQQGSTATDIAERTADKQRRLDNYKDALRSDINTPQNIGNSSLPGVGTHEFYGGPLSRAWDEEAGKVGGHYTSDIERSMRKYAEDNNSKLIIANVAVGESSSSRVYNIINQTTGDVVGQGDTYRQAEAIANDLVDNVGGRYKIKKDTDKNFETEPVFSIPLTKEMLQLNKIYK